MGAHWDDYDHIFCEKVSFCAKWAENKHVLDVSVLKMGVSLSQPSLYSFTIDKRHCTTFGLLRFFFMDLVVFMEWPVHKAGVPTHGHTQMDKVWQVPSMCSLLQFHFVQHQHILDVVYTSPGRIQDPQGTQPKVCNFLLAFCRSDDSFCGILQKLSQKWSDFSCSGKQDKCIRMHCLHDKCFIKLVPRGSTCVKTSTSQSVRYIDLLIGKYIATYLPVRAWEQENSLVSPWPNASCW